MEGVGEQTESGGAQQAPETGRIVVPLSPGAEAAGLGAG